MRNLRLLLLVVPLVGCERKAIALGESAVDSAWDTASMVYDDTSPPSPSILVTGGAIDPLLAPTLTLAITSQEGTAVRVVLTDADGAVVRTLADGTAMVETVTWDGRSDAGEVQPVGTYTVEAVLVDDEGLDLIASTSLVYVVRVGVLSGTLRGNRIPLIWHRGGAPGTYWVEDVDDTTFELSALDDGTAATPLPTLWDDLDVPPQSHIDHGLPAAYPYDALPQLTLAVSGEFGEAPVELSLSGWGVPQAVARATEATFGRDTALATGPTVVEESVTLTWSVQGQEIATQPLPLRFYALLREPTFEEDGAPYEPWVAAIDPALRAITGVSPTDDALSAALTEWIYRDLSLSYDTDYGASYYTSYSGRGYDDAEFDFSSFLGRRNGSTVNCTDCASILEAYADMLGADLSYTIILSNFQLNYIKAIGGTDFTHCPFGPGGCGFSYHAVTTADDALTIYDATLALDGDDDPSSPPNTELLVQAIDGEEYLDRLVMSGRSSYNYTQHVSLR